MKEPLERDYDFFLGNYRKWMANHKGQVVLIKDQHLVDFFNDRPSALQEGTLLFGRDFFVSEVKIQAPHRMAVLRRLR